MSNTTLLGKIYSKYDTILGSSSPRRKEILVRNIGFSEDKIHTMKPSFEEDLKKELYEKDLFGYVRDTVKHKALSLIPDLQKETHFKHENLLVICCDTTLIDPVHKIIYEKPNNNKEHLENLKHFCYTLHSLQCVSSVCIMDYSQLTKSYTLHEFNSVATLNFDGKIPEYILEDYVQSGEGSDAAGGFKIQECGSIFIKSISGDFFNIMGFPVNETIQKLLEIV